MIPASEMPGYAKLRVAGIRGLVIEPCKSVIENILSTGTLYAHAASRPDVRIFAGRAPVYAISLPDNCGNVVVRHAMRGGAFARTGTDLFFPPTRGLRELVNSLRLRISGVATPEVVAFITYRAGPVLRRSDVATREIPHGHDMWTVLTHIPPGEQRNACLRATARLVRSLSRAGAHHPDLNVRNVLITWEGNEGAVAHVLDVDRVRFHVPGDPMVAKANLARLEQSLRKRRGLNEIDVSEDEIALLAPTPVTK